MNENYLKLRKWISEKATLINSFDLPIGELLFYNYEWKSYVVIDKVSGGSEIYMPATNEDCTRLIELEKSKNEESVYEDDNGYVQVPVNIDPLIGEPFEMDIDLKHLKEDESKLESNSEIMSLEQHANMFSLKNILPLSCAENIKKFENNEEKREAVELANHLYRCFSEHDSKTCIATHLNCYSSNLRNYINIPEKIHGNELVQLHSRLDLCMVTGDIEFQVYDSNKGPCELTIRNYGGDLRITNVYDTLRYAINALLGVENNIFES